MSTTRTIEIAGLDIKAKDILLVMATLPDGTIGTSIDQSLNREQLNTLFRYVIDAIVERYDELENQQQKGQ